MATSHEMLRKLGLNFVVGFGFILSTIILTAILGSTLGVSIAGDIRDIGTGLAGMDAMIIGVSALGFILTGGLVYVWAKARKPIAKWMGYDVSDAPKLNNKGKITPILATLFAVGIIASVIIYGFTQLLAGLSPDIELSSITTLLDAVMTMNPMLIAGSFVAIVAFGWVVGLLGQAIDPVSKRVDQSKVIPKR